MNPQRIETLFLRTLLPGILLSGSVLSFQLSPQVQSSDSTAPAPPPDPVTDLLAQANDLAQNRFDNKKALALYSEALLLESANSEILWRISRSYIEIGEHLPTLSDEDKEEQLRMYEKGLEFADRSVAANPMSSMAFTTRAIARGRVALFTGLWGSVGMMKDIRADLHQALAFDSTNHLAFYALGATHMKVIEKPWILRWPLGLGWGSRGRAIALFEQAIVLKWDFIGYRLACARAYFEEGDYGRARAHLSLIPMLPTQDEDDGRYRAEARELLTRINSEEE
ncbi:MAG: hypothetical protein HYW57_00730 [Ignavibacteriales bacterium]|nr:hypothetical protein [Ignavibacteriales bacterium]